MSAQPTALLFDVQRASLVDGPGVRTTLFFSGCNLRCRWCHNPEGMGLSGVQLPAQYAPRRYTVAELADLVAEDIPFYGDSGGVTCSGGECMLQSDFLAAFFAECKRRGIHTCVDTAGKVPFAAFEKILPVTDLFLYDVKCVSPDRHKAFTGADNRLILDNLQRLFSLGAEVIVRVPFIPEFNGDEAELRRIRAFLAPFSPAKVELLAYHTLGEGKYNKLGLVHDKFTVPDDGAVKRAKAILEG